MKKSYLNFMSAASLILGVVLTIPVFAQKNVMAGRTDVVSKIEVSGLQSSAGKYLHVLYAVGRPGFLTVDNPVPYLDIIRPQSQSLLIQGNNLSFPSVEIDKTPGRGSYNMIVFVISTTATIRWQNVDENPNPPYQFKKVIFKNLMDQFQAASGEAGTYTLGL